MVGILHNFLCSNNLIVFYFDGGKHSLRINFKRRKVMENGNIIDSCFIKSNVQLL